MTLAALNDLLSRLEVREEVTRAEAAMSKKLAAQPKQQPKHKTDPSPEKKSGEHDYQKLASWIASRASSVVRRATTQTHAPRSVQSPR